MLARLPPAIRKDLLRKISIGLCCHAVGLVLQHRGALHRGLREPDSLADPGGEDAVTEVLLEDLDRLLGMDRATIDERWEDALDLDVGIELLTNHGQRVLKLDQPAHRQVLALD